MTCPDTLGALDAYLDNELSVMDILRVQGHLLRCDRCRAIAESEGVLYSLLATDALQDEPSARLRERILQKIGELPPPARPAPSWRRWAGRTAIGLAGALVVGMVVGVVLRSEGSAVRASRERHQARRQRLRRDVQGRNQLPRVHQRGQGSGAEAVSAGRSVGSESQYKADLYGSAR